MRCFRCLAAMSTLALAAQLPAQSAHDSLAAYADRIVKVADSAYREMPVLTVLESTDFALWSLDREKHQAPFSVDSLWTLTRSRQADVRARLLEFDARPAPAPVADIHRSIVDEFQQALADMDSLAGAASSCDLESVHNANLAKVLSRRCFLRLDAAIDRLRDRAKAYELSRDRVEARLKAEGLSLPCRPDPDGIVEKAMKDAGKPPCRP